MPFAADLEHGVITVLQIPVVYQRHHYLQALKLIGADERIFIPCPSIAALDVRGPRFEPHILKCADAGNAKPRDQVIDLGFIPDAPRQTDGGSLGLRFVGYLRDPDAPRSVTYAILQVVPAGLLLYQFYT